MTALLALLGLCILCLALRAWRRDSVRQKATRTRKVTLSQASRAACLADCPPEFLAILAERLEEARDGDEVPR